MKPVSWSVKLHLINKVNMKLPAVAETQRTTRPPWSYRPCPRPRYTPGPGTSAQRTLSTRTRHTHQAMPTASLSNFGEVIKDDNILKEVWRTGEQLCSLVILKMKLK